MLLSLTATFAVARADTALLVELVDQRGERISGEVEIQSLDSGNRQARQFHSGTLQTIPQGTYRVTGHARGFAPARRFADLYGKSVALRIGLNVAQSIDEEGVSLTGRVLLPSYAAVWLKLISLVNNHPAVDLPLRRDGSFLFSGLARGEYVLLIISGNQLIRAHPVSCFSNEVLTLTITETAVKGGKRGPRLKARKLVRERLDFQGL
ncbi:MAG: hypothetical protein IT168_10640 [Bryobacterales bacterium]|nr:hypothetical protein [Bryobacterales bacterium]